MEYVNLGSTGLRVSRVCLGMMSFGEHESRRWALPEEEAEPIVRRAVEGGITFFDTADVYNGGQSEVVTGRVAAEAPDPRGDGRRDQGLHADDARRERPRPLAKARHGVDRRIARAARDGLRRPVPDPPLGPDDADRGDDGGAPRRREGGKGALHRGEQHVRVAVRESAGHSRPSWLDAVRLDAEPLQPRLPRGGAGDDPAVRRPGSRGAAVEPARARSARRQPHARGRAPHNTGRQRRVRRRALRARGRLRRRRPGRARSRASEACRARRSRSRGSSPGPR